jgi:hypothetical protein
VRLRAREGIKVATKEPIPIIFASKYYSGN